MADPWQEPIDTFLGAFSDRLKASLIGRVATAYLQGSAQMVQWGRTKMTDRPIFYEGPPVRQAFEYAGKHCAQLVTKMDEETRDSLAQVIKQGIEDKRGIDGLARDIRNQFDDMTKNRATVIARTETADALEQGFMDRAKDLGVNGKEWIVTEPCPICEDNANAGVIGINEEFPSGHQRPPAHPNCRCALAPVMIKEGD